MRPLSIDDLTVELGFDSWANSRRVKTSAQQPFSLNGYHQRNEDFRLDETVGVRSSGSILRADIMQYDIFLRGGLSQESYDEHRPGPDLHKNPNGDLLEYDVRLQLFQQGKISGTAFASQLESRIPRPFLPSLDQVRNRFGGGLVYHDAKLPMSLSWESSEDRIHSRNSSLQDSENRSEDRLRYEATWQATDNHALRVEYEYENRKDQYSGTRTHFNTQRNLLSLVDTIQFGPEGKSRLETLLRAEAEQGDLAHDSFEISPQLRLQHTDKLFSTYRMQYLKEDFSQIDTRTFRADAGVTHLLGDSLTSTVNFYGLRQESDPNANVGEVGGLANFAYNRANDLGRFSANLAYLHSMTQTSDGGRDGAVIGEAVTFRDPLPALLQHGDVNTFTVAVTAIDRIQFFLPGRDYNVIRIGRYTSIARVPTGMILNGQTVLVSYTYRIANDFTLQRDRVDLRIQEDMKNGFTPYYAMSIQDENVSHDHFLNWQERDIHRHRAGVTYRQKSWSFGPEYEYNNDSVDPYQAVHLNGDAIIYRSARHELTGRATASRFWFDHGPDFEPARHTTLIDFGLNYRYQIADRLEANADGMFRIERDSLFGHTEGVDLKGSLAYHLGFFTLLFEVEYESLHLPDSGDDSVACWIKLRREIPVIGERPR